MEKTDCYFPCNVSFFFKAVNFLPCFIHASFDQLLTVEPLNSERGLLKVDILFSASSLFQNVGPRKS